MDRTPAAELLAVYDRALPQVYGYLVSRCGSAADAEELTSETFLAAVTSIKRGVVDDVTVAWLIGIARHKLADHFRRAAREERSLAAAAPEEARDPWDAAIDAHLAASVLERLGGHHRCVLTLRYVDGLPVPQVADVMGRTVHATEALLIRAKHAFREIAGEVR